jgi:TusA-related sulfurtransferase
MRVTGIEALPGFITVMGFVCPYYVVQAKKKAEQTVSNSCLTALAPLEGSG